MSLLELSISVKNLAHHSQLASCDISTLPQIPVCVCVYVMQPKVNVGEIIFHLGFDGKYRGRNLSRGCIKLKNGKRELRYQSPKGKVYYSLRMACKSVIDEYGEEGTVVSQDLESKQPRKRKCLKPSESFQSKPKKEKQKTPAKNQTKPRITVREGLLSSSCNPRTVLSWLIDNNAVSPLGKVYYRNKAGNPSRKGRITRHGIQCDCCFRVFTLTAFESHSGSTNHRPAANIMLDDGSGRSLSDCQRQVRDLMISKVESAKTVEGNSYERETDEVCSACRNGGELMCCDNCPSAFHSNCLGLKEVPDGDWFCPSCCCGICGIGHLSDDSFRTCHQCERKFHVGCLSLEESWNLKNYQTGKDWVCSYSCGNIFSGLRKLTGKPIPMQNNLTWTLLKSEACSDSDTDHAHGLEASVENHSKLSVALDVMHECFEPSEDVYTGRDLVEDVIFSRGSKLKRLNFKGFYTVILEENDDLVAVATVRVYGDKVAEMSLVATRFRNRRRGMCRVLVDELEKNLVKFGVEKLILPAVPSTVDTWTKNFGFSRMTDDERSELLQYTLLDFQGTIMCQKDLKTEAFVTD
ncbi:increased DNA methylation 1-like [Durio zibethinus]|uniref:Increased DNA methylation 1-like n=1 Tax=Durio zibethinus TaxID=66656 RepID=A0A6P6AM61_DURZI|nr:increased DNA methylation 1-like [Durio zibethinus]